MHRKRFFNLRTPFVPPPSASEMGQLFELGGSWAFWEAFDLGFLNRCDELWVYALPSWNASVRVAAEVLHAKRVKKPIT